MICFEAQFCSLISIRQTGAVKQALDKAIVEAQEMSNATSLGQNEEVNGEK